LTPARRAPPRPPLYWAIVILLGAGLLLLSPGLLRALQGSLADTTGETDPRQQAVALASALVPTRVETADLTAMRYIDGSHFGVNTFFEQEVEEWKLRKSMELLRAAGVTYVRQQMPWSDIEIPYKGWHINRYGEDTWAKYDKIVALAREYNLELVARLDFPPNWSRLDNRNTFAPPDRFSDFGDFVEAFVRRYRGQIHYYQIWNEPNTETEWKDEPVNAREFVELLKIGYERAKAVDPTVVILSPSLAPTLGTADGRYYSDVAYLEEMYKYGAARYFDILGVQGYGLWTGPGDRRLSEDRVNFSRPQLLRAVMVRNGDAAKPVWITEVGWNALPDDFPGPPTHGRVTLAQQALYTREAYARALDEWPWAGALFYWHFRLVHDENRDQVRYYFGLLDADFTVHPVYDAYRAVATAPPYLAYGWRQETNAALSWQGAWTQRSDPRASLGAFREGARAGDRLSFEFQGSDLELVTRVGPDAGRLSVSIDGANSPSLPPDASGRAVLDLKAPTEGWQARRVLVQGLPDRRHTATLEALDDGAPIAVDALIVRRQATSPWSGLTAVVIGAGLVVAGLLAVVRRVAGGH
jgi:hypothetical protein